MKVYKVTIYVIDHDGLGAEGIKTEMENTNFANDCILPIVDPKIRVADIGEWRDDHPLNQSAQMNELRQMTWFDE